LGPFEEFLEPGEVLLVSCCNVGRGGSRYSVALITAEGIDWLDLDAALDPARDKGVTGIAITQEHCFLAVHGEHERLVSLDRRLQLADVFSCEVARDLHSLSVHGDRLYIASTGTNQVLSVGCGGGRFSGPEQVHVTCGTTAEDQVHLNSLLVEEGRLLYSMFGVGPKSPVRDTGAVVDAGSDAALIYGLRDPHSLTRLAHGRLALCESLHSALCILEPGGALNRVSLRGYTRGIADTGRHLVVGASHWRSRSRSTTQVRGLPSHLGAGYQKHGEQSHLYVLRADLSLAHAIDFTPYASEIYDVVWLGRRFAPAAVFKQAAERRRQSKSALWRLGLFQSSRA
jgi:Domain of unknown function (DUF4915)